jgi:hypothetical protein
MAMKQDGVPGGRLAEPGFLFEVQPELLALHRYLARSIVETLACALAATQIGMLIMRGQISQVLGVDGIERRDTYG